MRRENKRHPKSQDPLLDAFLGYLVISGGFVLLAVLGGAI